MDLMDMEKGEFNEFSVSSLARGCVQLLLNTVTTALNTYSCISPNIYIITLIPSIKSCHCISILCLSLLPTVIAIVTSPTPLCCGKSTPAA